MEPTADEPIRDAADERPRADDDVETSPEDVSGADSAAPLLDAPEWDVTDSTGLVAEASDAAAPEASDWQVLGSLGPLPDDLAQLRALLVGPEQAEIARLRRRLRLLEQKGQGLAADAVAEALPDAVVENDRQGPRLATALAPTVRQSLQVAVREDPEPVAEAIFPIIGPAIRRAVTDAMRSMTSSINQTMERSLSLQSVGWRVEAARTGRPFSEIALSHMLQYRVEQVFLIDRETGLPHLHVVADDVPEPDAQLFAGMLTAIRDFAHDTLGASSDTLGRLQMGEMEVWIEAGPSAYVAAVVRGVPPPELRGTLAEVVEGVHLKYGRELAQPPGAVPLDPARPALAMALTRQLRETRKGLNPFAKTVLVLAALALVGWIGLSAWRAWAWRDAVARLRATPGVVVTEARRTGGTGHVEGLRDPLALNAQAVVSASRWKNRPVEWALRPFVSLEPTFVAARASRLLNAPSTVTLAVRGDTLVVGGRPDASFVEKARREGPYVDGVREVAIVRDFAAERAQMRQIAARLNATQLVFASNSSEPTGFAAAAADFAELERLAAATGTAYRAEVTGYASPEGTDAENQALSQIRAERTVERLVAAGAKAERFATRGAGVDASSEPSRQRRVVFRVNVGS